MLEHTHTLDQLESLVGIRLAICYHCHTHLLGLYLHFSHLPRMAVNTFHILFFCVQSVGNDEDQLSLQ